MFVGIMQPCGSVFVANMTAVALFSGQLSELIVAAGACNPRAAGGRSAAERGDRMALHGYGG